MLGVVANRLRFFFRSELDLAKDRLLAEIRTDDARIDPRFRAMREMGWTFDEGHPFEQIVGFGIAFDPKAHRHWIDGLPWLATLVKEKDASLNQLPDGRIALTIGSIRVVPETHQELGLLVEVWHDEVYNMECAEPVFVWDIGANAGFASLYFAARHGWDVAAFELCPPTADSAVENVKLSGLESKIKVHSIGIGGKDGTLEITYSSQIRGSNGIFGNVAWWDPQGEEQTLEVQIRDAANVFDEVAAQASGRPILAKIDCEGAEYEILDRLHQSGKLALISAIVMEAHVLPGLHPDRALSVLLNGGFIVHRTRKLSTPSTTFFASRRGV